MALVAFDLDNTLGFFYHIAPVGHLFSLDLLDNSETRGLNPNFQIPPRVRAAMARAEERFVEKILERQHLMRIILRPNLDAMLRPILHAKHLGRVRSVCIYSNAANPFSLTLAKKLIERIYRAPNLFCALVDATHRVRATDLKTIKHGEPIKTFTTIKAIFKRLCKYPLTIQPSDVIFVDERRPKHAVSAMEPEGLIYIQPNEYMPAVPRGHKGEILKLALECLIHEGLMTDEEYLNSSVFHCLKRKYINQRIRAIGNFHDLLEFIGEEMASADEVAKPFQNDTKALRQDLIRAIGRF
jgi:hypothetical protein